VRAAVGPPHRGSTIPMLFAAQGPSERRVALDATGAGAGPLGTSSCTRRYGPRWLHPRGVNSALLGGGASPLRRPGAEPHAGARPLRSVELHSTLRPSLIAAARSTTPRSGCRASCRHGPFRAAGAPRARARPLRRPGAERHAGARPLRSVELHSTLRASLIAAAQSTTPRSGRASCKGTAPSAPRG
jgi:hypothetical protein